MSIRRYLWAATLVLLYAIAGPGWPLARGEADSFLVRPDGRVEVEGLSFRTLTEYYLSSYFQATGRRCKTLPMAPEARLMAAASDCDLSQTVLETEYWPSRVFLIPVAVHIITKTDGTGNLSDERIARQIQVLNEDFRAITGTLGQNGFDTHIQFYLHSIDRTANDNWYNDKNESTYKATLGLDPTRYLNIYTNTAGGYLGYSYYPQEMAGDTLDGVVLNYEAVGGRDEGSAPYNQGRSATHEIGHYLGLMHTFEGGACLNGLTVGDLIADTNPENTEHYGCTQTQSCGVDDPIRNYMDYTDDTCMEEFTREQGNRMVCCIVNYRPNLARRYVLSVPVPPDYDGDGQTDLAGRSPSSGDWYVGLSDAGTLTTTRWGRWSAASSWSKAFPGDFDGDGRTDIAGRVATSGDWYVGLSTGTTFTTTKWGGWSPAAAWSPVLAGDFDGDGLSDLAGRVSASGDWYMALSTGSAFHTVKWGNWSAGTTWAQAVTGDFNADGITDLAGRSAASGDWWVSLSSGSAFATTKWGNWSAALTWSEVRSGDFNADGRTDLAGREASTGCWWVSLSTGAAFATTNWGRWSPGTTWLDVLAGDFNGDGRTDLAGRTASTGDWWVGLASGAGSFTTSRFGKWSTGIDWLDVAAGDGNGDGVSDVVGRAGNTGTWWDASSNGSAFATASAGTWSPATDWQMVGE